MPSDSPRILTTTVGSYPVPDWLSALPSEQALIDATRVVFDTQRQAGIDLPTDGELYRFDVNHPDTNGMIDYFVSRMGGCSSRIGRSAAEAFAAKAEMGFRRKPAAVVEGPLAEGTLDLFTDCRRAANVAGGPFKFTLTSPYMLARTLLDRHYGDFERLLHAVADVLADQVRGLPCACVQIDEANIPGNPEHADLAAAAINRVLDAIDDTTERGTAFQAVNHGQDARATRAVHLCFGNYGGQTIQKGTWEKLLGFLNALNTHHLVLELAHRPQADLDALKEVRPEIALGIGVIDVKINPVETPEQIARAIEIAEKTLGAGRVRFVHPDCGLWMLKRSVADRKIAALARGRDLYLGRVGQGPTRAGEQ